MATWNIFDRLAQRPSEMGPAGEKPTKTASDGKVKIGFFKSTNQWMLVPNKQGATQ